jgi:predicted PurR-regulated permease PerM
VASVEGRPPGVCRREAAAPVMGDRPHHVPQRQTAEGWLSRERALVLVLLVATALVVYLCYRLAGPFLPALAWAVALAAVAHPLHGWLLRRIPRPNLAAGLAVGLVAVAIVGPTLLVSQQLVREVARGVAWLQSDTAAGRWQAVLEDHPRLATGLTLLATQVDVRGATERASMALTSGAEGVVRGSVWAVAELLITFFALFYCFRDRRQALQNLRSLVPLSEGETEAVFTRVIDTLHATIYGTLLVGLVQGVMGGLMFWALGLPAALLWGVVMAILGIIPVLGTFIVWAPAALFLALEGGWGKAMILVAWGGLVVSLVDNLLYPILAGQRLRLHTLPVFIAIVGGVALFGSAGIVLGPVTLATTIALIEVWRRRTAGGRTAETGVDVSRG